MTCKDCIHYDVCGLNEYKDFNEICSFFKDKLRIAELPCKVGNEAYLISIKRYSPLLYKFVKAKVIGFKINRSGIYNIELKTLESDFTFTRHISEVYFDKSEAEAKLKEINNEC